MDGSLLPLLEAGVIQVITREELSKSTYDFILGDEDDDPSHLSDPSERFKAAEQVLQSWRDKLPRLPVPGISLCQRCEDIEVEVLKSSDGYMHSEDYWRVAASAEQCPMCAFIVGALRDAYPTSDFDTAMRLNHPLRTDLRILLRAGYGDVKESDHAHEIETIRVEMTNMAPFIPTGRLCVFALPGSPAARHGLQQRLAPDEAEKFAIMFRWVRLSPRERLLASPATSQEYPRRLIDIGPVSESPATNVRIVEKLTLPSQCVEYIALSYRWGTQNNLKTTKKTLGDHQKGISVKSLPKTLRDAVTVTRRLSIRYLWIDSLCIIQDDTTDWATEAAHMGDIFMNSAFTIAAHAAGHANDGFLEQALARPEPIPVGGHRNGGSYDVETAAYAAFQQTETNTREKGRDEEDQISPLESEAFFVTESSQSRGHLDNSELSSRGWVLQERILSQKTIHFCRDGVIYLETEGSLLQINNRPDRPRYFEYRAVREALSTFYSECKHRGDCIVGGGCNTCPRPNPELLANVRQNWYNLVARYSTCSLTEPRDKLVAISGIAHKLQSILNDKYYCGLWERHFYTNLLWLRRNDRLTPSNSPNRARAPSWSWAAHDGEIQFPIWSHSGSDAFIQPEIRFGMVLNHELPPSKDSLFDGWGMLVLHDAVRIGTGLRFVKARTGKPQWQLIPNSVTMSYQTRFWDVASDAGNSIGWAALDWEEREDVDGDVDLITCFKVASFTNDRPESGFKRGFMVLFVKLVNRSLGIFGRVGMGQITDASLFDEQDESKRHKRLMLV